MLMNMFRDAEPEQSSTPQGEEQQQQQQQQQSEAEKPTYTNDQFYAMKRRLEKFENKELERERQAEQKEKAAKAAELAKQDKFDEILKQHQKEVDELNSRWESQLKTERIKTQLGRNFHPAFFEHALTKLADAEDTDAAIQALVENPDYSAFKINASQTQTIKRDAAALPAIAGPKTSTSQYDDLYSRVNSDDMSVRKEALKEELALKFKGELEPDWRKKR
jgi:hypothetical protein